MSSKKSSTVKKLDTDPVQADLVEEPEYEVESVLAKKTIDSHVYYQIKWKG